MSTAMPVGALVSGPTGALQADARRADAYDWQLATLDGCEDIAVTASTDAKIFAFLLPKSLAAYFLDRQAPHPVQEPDDTVPSSSRDNPAPRPVPCSPFVEIAFDRGTNAWTTSEPRTGVPEELTDESGRALALLPGVALKEKVACLEPIEERTDPRTTGDSRDRRPRPRFCLHERSRQACDLSMSSTSTAGGDLTCEPCEDPNPPIEPYNDDCAPARSDDGFGLCDGTPISGNCGPKAPGVGACTPGRWPRVKGGERRIYLDPNPIPGNCEDTEGTDAEPLRSLGCALRRAEALATTSSATPVITLRSTTSGTTELTGELIFSGNLTLRGCGEANISMSSTATISKGKVALEFLSLDFSDIHPGSPAIRVLGRAELVLIDARIVRSQGVDPGGDGLMLENSSSVVAERLHIVGAQQAIRAHRPSQATDDCPSPGPSIEVTNAVLCGGSETGDSPLVDWCGDFKGKMLHIASRNSGLEFNDGSSANLSSVSINAAGFGIITRDADIEADKIHVMRSGGAAFAALWPCKDTLTDVVLVSQEQLKSEIASHVDNEHLNECIRGVGLCQVQACGEAPSENSGPSLLSRFAITATIGVVVENRNLELSHGTIRSTRAFESLSDWLDYDPINVEVKATKLGLGERQP